MSEESISIKVEAYNGMLEKINHLEQSRAALKKQNRKLRERLKNEKQKNGPPLGVIRE